ARLEDATAERLSRAVIDAGIALGFSRVGIADAGPLERGRERLEAFRRRGFAGGLDYLERGDRHDPSALLPGARSAVVALFAHGDPRVVPVEALTSRLRGSVARYAQGDDYHLLLKTLLFELARRVADLSGRSLRARVCVDSAPLLERELALRAGLGFQGKSTLLIAPGVGSYVVIGELLLDVELAPTSGGSAGCGTCRACLDACPTQAFSEEYVLDARRCISYLTIEREGEIPRELRAPIGNRVFGCDVCQETCPFNASPSRPEASALGRREALASPDLVALLNLGSAAYRKLVKRTALRRASRTTLQRNAAIALGNSADERALDPLCVALANHADPIVRLHVAWALGELCASIGPRPQARESLARAALEDPERAVRDECGHALGRGYCSSVAASSAR
ncbi:MAG TPA: tRNA epoxyqueuosine(34) reductase QueG, partial [Polyangiaceae bacterium]|nr:tRNA epoxyqueuosine(34) reductase QueG [Polyangiaceae bacterium]